MLHAGVQNLGDDENNGKLLFDYGWYSATDRWG